MIPTLAVPSCESHLVINDEPLIPHLLDYRDAFIKNPDGSEYIGQVWPGYTVSVHHYTLFYA